MSKNKYRVFTDIIVDTDEYPVPSDGRLRQSLKDDIKDAIESSVQVKVVGIGITQLLNYEDPNESI